jgi:hypothetical protein
VGSPEWPPRSSEASAANAETVVKMVAQYLPVNNGDWADIAECGDLDRARRLIELNIEEWGKVPAIAQMFRPSQYRVIRREVTESVITSVTDDGAREER